MYLASFFSLPVEREDGTKLSHEQVVKQLDDGTVAYDNGLGLDGYFNELIRVSIKVEVSKYEATINWLRDLLYGSEFNKDR